MWVRVFIVVSEYVHATNCVCTVLREERKLCMSISYSKSAVFVLLAGAARRHRPLAKHPGTRQYETDEGVPKRYGQVLCNTAMKACTVNRVEY